MNAESAQNYFETANELIDYLDINKEHLESVGVNSFLISLDYNYLITYEATYLTYIVDSDIGSNFLYFSDYLDILKKSSDAHRNKTILIVENIDFICKKLVHTSIFSNFSSRIEKYNLDQTFSILGSKKIDFNKDYKKQVEEILISDELKNIVRVASNYQDLNNALISSNNPIINKIKV